MLENSNVSYSGHLKKQMQIFRFNFELKQDFIAVEHISKKK